MTDKTNEAVAVVIVREHYEFDQLRNISWLIPESESLPPVGTLLYTAPTDGVRRGMEMALAAINAERLHDPTDSADDRAYEMAIEDCDSAVRTLIAALPLAQEDAKDAPEIARPSAERAVTIDELAQFIRVADGKHQMGAGALAERIVDWLADRAATPSSIVRDAEQEGSRQQ